MNYLRYSLRFISSYTYVAFTIQRLYVVLHPLSSRSMTKKLAWINICSIGIVAFLLMAWVPFTFHIIVLQNHPKDIFYCDVNKEYKLLYYITGSLYICLTIFIPSVIIFVCNIKIIYKTFQNKTWRKELTNQNKSSGISSIISINSHLFQKLKQHFISKFYFYINFFGSIKLLTFGSRAFLKKINFFFWFNSFFLKKTSDWHTKTLKMHISFRLFPLCKVLGVRLNFAQKSNDKF